MPSTTSHHRSLLLSRLMGVASAVSARMPPSPRLSAYKMKITYLIVTTMMSDQKTSDSTP